MILAALIGLGMVLLSGQTSCAQENQQSDAKLKETKSCNEFAPLRNGSLKSLFT
jgi:hypothetical protein